MQLSTGIRLGAMLKPQAFGELWVRGGSCALGAALDAVSETPGAQLDEWDQICRLFPVLRYLEAAEVRCPVCGVHSTMTVITHLNDQHRWTREAIADWVETLERTYAPPANEVATNADAVASCANELEPSTRV